MESAKGDLRGDPVDRSGQDAGTRDTASASSSYHTTSDLAGLRIRTQQIISELKERIAVADRVAATGKAPHVAVYVPFTLAENLLSALQGLQDEIEALKPADLTADECSLAVHTLRMRRSGYSYDAKAGIWWKDDSKPGVLQALELDLTRTRQELDEAETETQRIADCWQAAHERAEALQATLTRLQAGGYVQHLLGCPHKHRGDNDAGCTCGLVSLQVPEPSAVARPDSLA